MNASRTSDRAASPGALVASRVALDRGAPLDPYALAGADGIVLRSERLVLVGLGTAARLPLANGLGERAALDRVVEWLESVECVDRLGGAGDGVPSPVVAFGALPFDRTAPAELVVPEILVGIDRQGHDWLTVVTADRDGLPRSSSGVRRWLASGSARTPANRPAVASIRPRSSDEEFTRGVADALAAIEAGELEKVVLARQVDVEMAQTIEIPDLLRRWGELEPGCTLFSLPPPVAGSTEGRFVGASPELLVERTGGRVRSRPLAGTTGRSSDGAAGRLPPELLDSPKDATEHRLVVEAIEGALRPLSGDLGAPSRPDLVHLHSIVHLGSEVAGTLDARADGSVPHALELVALLHPTPAVAGTPTAPALAAIERLEPEGRGAYAGPVGFVDSNGDGRWVVGIRSMTVAGREARLAAGVGIVRGSDPATELAETELKLQSVFGALAPDAPFSTAGVLPSPTP